MYAIATFIISTPIMGYLIWKQWNIYSYAKKLIANGKEIPAKVSGIIFKEAESKTYYQTEVEFNYFGKRMIVKDEVLLDKNNYEIGQPLTIYYDGNEASKIWIKGHSPNLVKRILYLLIFVYFVIITATILIYEIT